MHASNSVRSIIFFGGGGGGQEWCIERGNSERCLKWDGGGSLMNLFYNNFKGYWVKAEIVCREEGILKVSPAPAFPIKILIVHIQEQIQRRPI